jgi:hypothetical protein
MLSFSVDSHDTGSCQRIDVRSRMGLYRDEADHIPKFPAKDRVSESSSWLVDLQVTRF